MEMLQMKRVILIGCMVVVLLALLLGSSSPVRAGNPSVTGQPSQSCQSQPSSPGNASGNPASPFNETVAGGSTAGNNYAGSQPQNSNNPNSVSQYDVACYQVSTH